MYPFVEYFYLFSKKRAEKKRATLYFPAHDWHSVSNSLLPH